jgi:hypothetical protein
MSNSSTTSRRGNSSGNSYRRPTADRLGQVAQSQQMRHWWFN